MASKNELAEMLKDLDDHKRDKGQLLEHYISERLAKSLANYQADLEEDYNYLLKKDSKRVLKILNR